MINLLCRLWRYVAPDVFSKEVVLIAYGLILVLLACGIYQLTQLIGELLW